MGRFTLAARNFDIITAHHDSLAKDLPFALRVAGNTDILQSLRILDQLYS